MLLRLLLCSVSLLLLVAPSAFADPIRYTTEVNISGGGTSTPLIRFEGTAGTFEPGSTLSLGHFVISAPPPGTSAGLDGKTFIIGLRTPDFDRAAPPSDTGSYIGPSYSSLIIQGHFTGRIEDGSPPGVVAIFDSVEIGFAGPIPTVLHLAPTFPVPLADVKLPAGQMLMIPTDSWAEGEPHYSGEVVVQITPEPATWALWGLIGIGATLARRRTRI